MLATLRQRDFGLLWTAGLVSFIGNLALFIALPLHVYRLTSSTLATAATLASGTLPRVLGGSVAGVFVDRWDRKKTMIVADASRALLLLPLALAPDRLVLVYAISAIMSTIHLFFMPAERALLPRLAGEERLVTANALNSLNSNLGLLVGPVIGTLTYAWIGLPGVALADAATFVVSALLIRLIVADARPLGRTADEIDAASAWMRVVGEWRAGLSLIRRNQALRVIFVAGVFSGLAEGIFLTLGLTPLVLDVLGGTAAQVGWLFGAQAAGGLVAGVVVARFGSRLATRKLFGWGIVGIGLADLGSANSRRLAGPGTAAVGVAMGWMAAAGVPAVAGVAGEQSMIQAESTDAFRGRVFGALIAVQGVAMLVGFGLGGGLGEVTGIVPVLSAGALVRCLGGVIALLLLPREQQNRVPQVETSG